MPQTIKLAYILICLYSVVLFFVWLNNYLKLGLKFDLSVYTALLITPYVFPSDKITYTVLYSCVGFVQDQTPNSALDNTGKRFTRKTTFFSVHTKLTQRGCLAVRYDIRTLY